MAAVLALNFGMALAALGVEAAFGYPAILFRIAGHPVTWTGALIAALDRWFNNEAAPARIRRLWGAAALAVVLLLCGSAGAAAQTLAFTVFPRGAALFVSALLASACLAQRSLDRHVHAVGDALRRSGLEEGRRAVSMIVGRDTAGLDEAGIARAAIESLAENFSDGIVAPCCFIAFFGLPGGLLYKAANTADSMIGHRTPRHEAFGFAAAKFDDVLNWPAARLAGLAIVGAAALLPGTSAARAWRVMLRDAGGHASPNAGWPEAAMAGALGITLGGPRSYAGTIVQDAGMGSGPAPGLADIARALWIYRLACLLNALLVLAAVCLIVRW